MHPDLVKEFITEFHDELNAESHSRAQLEQQTRQELADVDRRLDSLIAAIAEGFRSVDLQNKLDGLSAQKRKLERKLEEAEPSVPVLHPNLAVLYRRKVVELTSLFGHPQDQDEAVTIIRSFIDNFVVGSTVGGFRVEFGGEIANMIKIPHGNAAMNIEKCKIAVKRVAGAGLVQAPTITRHV